MDKLKGRDLVTCYKVAKKVNELIDILEESGGDDKSGEEKKTE